MSIDLTFEELLILKKNELKTRRVFSRVSSTSLRKRPNLTELKGILIGQFV